MNFKLPYEQYQNEGTINDEVSLTVQSQGAECNINSIVERYEKTGILGSEGEINKGVFGDFSQIRSYQQAQDMLIAANESFMALPGRIRERFANNPGELLEFVANPQNTEEAIRLGILVKRPPEAPEEPKLTSAEWLAKQEKKPELKPAA